MWCTLPSCGTRCARQVSTGRRRAGEAQRSSLLSLCLFNHHIWHIWHTGWDNTLYSWTRTSGPAAGAEAADALCKWAHVEFDVGMSGGKAAAAGGQQQPEQGAALALLRGPPLTQVNPGVLRLGAEQLSENGATRPEARRVHMPVWQQLVCTPAPSPSRSPHSHTHPPAHPLPTYGRLSVAWSCAPFPRTWPPSLQKHVMP